MPVEVRGSASALANSITRGYYDAVDKALQGQANCARYCTSKYLGHADFLKELTILLDAYTPDVIHINSGLHGWGYTEEQYAAAFGPLFEVLAQHAPQDLLRRRLRAPHGKSARSVQRPSFHDSSAVVAAKLPRATELMLSSLEVSTTNIR